MLTFVVCCQPDLAPDFDDFLMLEPPASLEMDMLSIPHQQHHQYHQHQHHHQQHTSTATNHSLYLPALDDALLPPDLLYSGDDGYNSFPPSPSEVTALVDSVTWPCFDADAQQQAQLSLSCEPASGTYFPSGPAIVPAYPPAGSLFDESGISDLVPVSPHSSLSYSVF